MTETLPGAMLSTYLYLVISYTHTNTHTPGKQASFTCYQKKKKVAQKFEVKNKNNICTFQVDYDVPDLLLST